MARLSVVAALVLSAVLGASCLSDYGAAPFACAKSSACPDGYRCVSGVCRREGAPPSDARPDMYLPPLPEVGASDLPKPSDSAVRDLLAGKELAKPDQPGGLTCAQIGACFSGCAGYQPCLTVCLSQGSPDGQAKMSALLSCQAGASAGICYDQCHNQGQAVCAACLNVACAAEASACS